MHNKTSLLVTIFSISLCVLALESGVILAQVTNSGSIEENRPLYRDGKLVGESGESGGSSSI
ncbi:hypothetical protein HN512_05090, partial [Candidatus Peregrinibacteria bacterium]|nr:hypothetical protein [Candidatus Peregrinibacteria bacterium]